MPRTYTSDEARAFLEEKGRIVGRRLAKKELVRRLLKGLPLSDNPATDATDSPYEAQYVYS
jgi:hypothetical protein